MIRLCKNLFYKPKYGSDADSMILKRLFSTVTVVLVCLAAISFSAYAFFSYSVTSGTNTIKSSSFSTSVTIEKDQKLVAQGGIQSYYFDTPGAYTVTITAGDGTTGTGFGIVSVNGTKYYTQQLGKDLNAPNQERKEVKFTLKVDVTAEVMFKSRWGTSSNYDISNTENKFYITNTNPLQIIVVDGTQNIAENTEESKPEETASESTTESTTESTSPEVTVPTTDSTETVHTVLAGESLASIADKYGTTYPILAAYNNLEDPRVIQPSQKIRIPPAEGETPEATTSPETTPETTAPTEQTEPATTLPDETQSATETTGISPQ